MITGFFLSITVSFVGFLIGLLPYGEISTNFTSAINYVVGVLNTFNYLLPISTLFTVLGLVVAFDIALWFWQFSKWITRLIRGH